MKDKTAKPGRKFYNEHLDQIPEPEHNGWFLTTEPESSQYE